MEPNRKDSTNPDRSDEQKKPKGNIWLTLIITLSLAMIVSWVWNAVSDSQYTETTYSDFLASIEKNELAEAQLN